MGKNQPKIDAAFAHNDGVMPGGDLHSHVHGRTEYTEKRFYSSKYNMLWVQLP